MAMKLLRARETTDAFVHVVHIDTSKVMADGGPDPNYVRTFRHDNDYASRGLTRVQYVTRIRKEIKLALQPGDGVDGGTALAGEGNEF